MHPYRELAKHSKAWEMREIARRASGKRDARAMERASQVHAKALIEIRASAESGGFRWPVLHSDIVPTDERSGWDWALDEKVYERLIALLTADGFTVEHVKERMNGDDRGGLDVRWREVDGEVPL